VRRRRANGFEDTEQHGLDLSDELLDRSLALFADEVASHCD